MKRYKFLVLLLLIPFQLFAQKTSTDWPGKQKIRLTGVIKKHVALYAKVLDKLGADKIITDFVLTDVKTGSVIKVGLGNEAEAFLYWPRELGFALTLIDYHLDENGKLPRDLKYYKIELIDKQLQVTEKFISSSHIFPFLKKFKKYQKMR